MNINVVRKVVSENEAAKISEAVAAFESGRKNLLHVEGTNDGEILTHLLAAEFVRTRVDQGTELNQAIREYAQRVKSMIAPSGGFKKP